MNRRHHNHRGNGGGGYRQGGGGAAHSPCSLRRHSSHDSFPSMPPSPCQQTGNPGNNYEIESSISADSAGRRRRARARMMNRPPGLMSNFHPRALCPTPMSPMELPPPAVNLRTPGKHRQRSPPQRQSKRLTRGRHPYNKSAVKSAQRKLMESDGNPRYVSLTSITQTVETRRRGQQQWSTETVISSSLDFTTLTLNEGGNGPQRGGNRFGGGNRHVDPMMAADDSQFYSGHPDTPTSGNGGMMDPFASNSGPSTMCTQGYFENEYGDEDEGMGDHHPPTSSYHAMAATAHISSGRFGASPPTPQLSPQPSPSTTFMDSAGSSIMLPQSMVPGGGSGMMYSGAHSSLDEMEELVLS